MLLHPKVILTHRKGCQTPFGCKIGDFETLRGLFLANFFMRGCVISLMTIGDDTVSFKYHLTKNDENRLKNMLGMATLILRGCVNFWICGDYFGQWGSLWHPLKPKWEEAVNNVNKWPGLAIFFQIGYPHLLQTIWTKLYHWGIICTQNDKY